LSAELLQRVLHQGCEQTEMIPHHATAVTLADEEAQNGTHQPLKSMARGIVAAQGKEIGQMQALLG
jgi:uncharacterized protein (DUF305 family)